MKNFKPLTQKEHETREKALRQIGWKNMTDEQKKEDTLLDWIDMIVSCFTYGEEYRLEHYRESYGKGYFTPKELDRIAEKQLEYLRTNAKVTHGVYTDSEDCTYNSVTW